MKTYYTYNDSIKSSAATVEDIGNLFHRPLQARQIAAALSLGSSRTSSQASPIIWQVWDNANLPQDVHALTDALTKHGFANRIGVNAHNGKPIVQFFMVNYNFEA